MDVAADVKIDESQCQGQGQAVHEKDDFTNLLNIDLVKDEILKSLDGSALLNLSLVNKGIRQQVISSLQFKKQVNLKVSTKSLDLFTPTGGPLPEWTAHLAHLTLVCNSDSELVFVSQEMYLSLARTLPSLSTLEIISDTKPYTYANTFVNKILSLSSNLKSLSIPYSFMLNPIHFDLKLCQNLEELKFTTSPTMIQISKNFDHFEQNLKVFATNCINLKCLSCQEVVKVRRRHVKLYDEDYQYFYRIFEIIDKNSQDLVKLEFGLSQLIVDPNFSSKLAEISIPNLKFLDVRAVTPENDFYLSAPLLLLDILNNLVQPGQLTTLKLTLTRFPLELFDLIPEKFFQLKSLSLKASKYNSDIEITEHSWSFLQLLTELEELEITKFILDETMSNFDLEIGQNFPDFLQNNNLRKLSLKGVFQVLGPTFFNGIAKMNKLMELRITGCSMNLNNFLTICENLKLLEKLEISHLHASKFEDSHMPSRDKEKKLEKYHLEISTFLSSLNYLKELSVELWDGDFHKVLESMSFPYLKSLTLCNAFLGKEQVENIIGLNGMLKELSIVSLREGFYGQEENFAIVNDRTLEIDFSTKQVKSSPSGRGEVRANSDPDSKPLNKQKITWPAWEYRWDD